MFVQVVSALVPNDPLSVARLVGCTLSGTVTYALMARKMSRRNPSVSPSQPTSLADRIRARMAEQPEIVPMSDALVERIAGHLAPVKPDAVAGAAAASDQ